MNLKNIRNRRHTNKNIKKRTPRLRKSKLSFRAKPKPGSKSKLSFKAKLAPGKRRRAKSNATIKDKSRVEAPPAVRGSRAKSNATIKDKSRVAIPPAVRGSRVKSNATIKDKSRVAIPPAVRRSRANLHDSVFKQIYSRRRYCLDIFRLVLTPQEFKLFNWNTLKPQITTFVDEQGQEKRTDLIFSVKLKKSHKTAQIFFLIEHKSRNRKGTLTQMLSYQTGIYKRSSAPVICVLVYNGEAKRYRGKLSFQDSLKDFTPALRRRFGKNVLNFTCRLLNIQALDISKEARHLTSRPILYILQNIWRLDKGVIRQLFKISRGLGRKDRKFLIDKAGDYIRRYDPDFSWKLVHEIEKKTVKKKEERVMSPLQETLDEEREKGLQKGLLQGMQKGRMERDKEVIVRMLQEKAEISFISKVTGLSKAQIKKLQNGVRRNSK